MKKIIFSVAVMVSAFFAASCQQEMLETQAGTNTVTYTVDVPSAIATKAIGDQVTAVDKVYYEVYRAAEVEDLSKAPVYQGDKPVINNSASFDLEFVKNQEFVVLFWAQSSALVNTDVTSEEGMYNINDLRKIQLVNPGAANNEAAQVFAGKDEVSNCTSAANGNVTLTHPVSQINVYTTAESLSFGDVTIGLSTSDMTVAGLYNTYNVATGDAVDADENESTFVYAEAAVPTATADNAALKYVAMNYVGFAPKNGTTVNVGFKIQTTEEVKIEHSVSNVPVKPNFRTNITGNLITATTDYNVTLDDKWSNAEITHATNTEAAQAALDNAAAGTTIQLHPGVNYGTLYLRPVAGSHATKEVDWLGNNYRYETYSLFENLTILGAEGATVDAIKIEGGTYYNTAHSQSQLYPVMLSLIELKNVVIDGVTFTGKGGYDPQGYGNAVNLSGNNIKVDGLTFKNCVLNNSENNARLLYKTEGTTTVHNYAYDGENYTFSPSLKDITITGCTLNGGYMGLELREAENVTITNNTFNVADRNILLPVNTGCTYSGNITITGNVSNDAKERFVRADGTGDAVVVISNNTLNNYKGADADYIKVSNGNNVTIENNTLASRTVPTNNTEDVVLNTETIEVTVPAESAEAGATYKVVVSNENTETDSTTGETTVGFDLTMYKNDVKVSGDVIYEVTKNLGAGLSISEVTHNGIALVGANTGADQTYKYNSATGVLTIYTKSFSPFVVTYTVPKDYVRKLNAGHNKNSTISVSTGSDFLPIVAVNPEIYGYSVYDGDTRIANEVHFQFAKVKKETINKNSYKVSFELAIKDENGNELEIKDGRMNPYNTTDPREHLKVYMNLIEVPEGYSISEVKVGGTSLTLTANQSGNCATGEYWIGSNPKDLYFQSRTAGLVEVVVKASQIDYVRKLNAAHNKNSTISVSTGSDFLPIVAVNPEIYGYSVYDGDTRIANAVTFRFSKVNKESLNENSYKVSFNLAVLDENGNELEIKDGRMNPYNTTDPREHLKVYMNLIEVPEGYSVSEVKVGGTSLTLTANQSGNCATGEYWIGSDPKDLYFQSRTAGLVEVIVAK